MVGDSKPHLEHGMPEKMVGAESLDMCRDKDTGLLTLQAGDRPSHSLTYTALHSTDRSAHRKRQILWGHVLLSNSLFTKHRINFRKQSVRFVVTV